VVRSDQCPYLVDATKTVIGAARKAGRECRAVKLDSRAELLEHASEGMTHILLRGDSMFKHPQQNALTNPGKSTKSQTINIAKMI
jgi:hypothetical protein